MSLFFKNSILKGLKGLEGLKGLIQVKEVDLFIGCPACDGHDKKPSFWRHCKCGKRTTITDGGYVGCRNVRAGDYSCVDKKFMECKWACSEHKHTYKPTNSNKFSAAGIVRASLRLGQMLKNKDITEEQYDTVVDALEKIAKQLDA
eukprot:CAMPEP_0201574866 /NCGR_PEP_ID=MMETSP0190_2-20130828/19634_1 /ASSEMBLY_ACC=CAM_ASM_000263 /TAXON_ID=37353 /ORGANISM="Rosalina sp." /LENGTH=145 /DNA_ID=CAMNT_0048003707 /DNA_START=22 /DNA_END=459 /DNA_ORIENTATION=-